MNDESRDVTIRELVTRSHSLAVSKGWYQGQTWDDGEVKSHAINVPEKLALIHSEVSEALEAYRIDGTHTRCWFCNGEGLVEGSPCAECDGAALQQIHYDAKGKPEGVITELADVLIRIADLCGALNLDLATAIEIKHSYNATREFRHGGKRA